MSNQHDRLLDHACQWLRDERRCSVVLREPRTAGFSSDMYIPDALGIEPDGTADEVEVKVSWEDYRQQDFKKQQLRVRRYWYCVNMKLWNRLRKTLTPDAGYLVVHEDGVMEEMIEATEKDVNTPDYRVCQFLAQEIARLRREGARTRTDERSLERNWAFRVASHVKEYPGCISKAICSHTDPPMKNPTMKLIRLARDGKVPGVMVDETEFPATFWPRTKGAQ